MLKEAIKKHKEGETQTVILRLMSQFAIKKKKKVPVMATWVLFAPYHHI